MNKIEMNKISFRKIFFEISMRLNELLKNIVKQRINEENIENTSSA